MTKTLKQRILIALYLSIIIAIIFTTIDAIIHDSIDYLKILGASSMGLSRFMWYIINKFVGTIIIGTILLTFLLKSKLKNNIKALIYTLPIIIILQARYFYQGYSPMWHTIILFLHFIILYF